ncbi:hypothetical protein KBH77_00025 [Patescibacteria group bacterium]|nr:hypothetical protein [Patescibacteria group bacterium]
MEKQRGLVSRIMLSIIIEDDRYLLMEQVGENTYTIPTAKLDYNEGLYGCISQYLYHNANLNLFFLEKDHKKNILFNKTFEPLFIVDDIYEGNQDVQIIYALSLKNIKLPFINEPKFKWVKDPNIIFIPKEDLNRILLYMNKFALGECEE